MIADKDYGLTTDGELVEQSDPRSATVLWGKGRQVGDAEAEKYGLAKLQGTQTEAPTESPAESVEAKAVIAPPENKAVSGPAESKSPKTK